MLSMCPTGIADNSSTLIDLIITSVSHKFSLFLWNIRKVEIGLIDDLFTEEGDEQKIQTPHLGTKQRNLCT